MFISALVVRCYEVVIKSVYASYMLVLEELEQVYNQFTETRIEK